MWAVNGNDLRMTEGDFGVELPIKVSGTTFALSDEIKFTLKNRMNGDELLTKTFSNIADNTINLELTEEESDKLEVGTYLYSLDWFQDGAFLCNIIPSATLKVVDKV